MCAPLFMFWVYSLGFESLRRSRSLSLSIDFVLPFPQFGVNTVFFRTVLSNMLATSHMWPYKFTSKLSKI